jgi:hypothetical protein
VIVLERTVSNDFILPVPVVRKEYGFCLETVDQTQPLWRPYEEPVEEVGPGKTKTIHVRVQPVGIASDDVPVAILIYAEDQDLNCAATDAQPLYRIPVV